MRRPEPYERYQNVPVFLYQEVGGNAQEWGALVQWKRRLIKVEVSNGHCPTWEDVLAAAHRLIDQLKQSPSEPER